MDEEGADLAAAPNDWNEHVADLPDCPRSLMQQRFRQFFALDVEGHKGHDMYAFFLPNGVCVVGLAPTHPLIQQHRHAAADVMHVDGGEQHAAPSSAAGAAAAPADVHTAEAAAAVGAADAPVSGSATACQPGVAADAAGSREDAPPAEASGAQAQGGGAAVGPPDQGKPGGKRGRSGGGPGGGQSGGDKRAGGGSGGGGARTSRVDSFPLARLKRVDFEVGRYSRGDVRDSGKKKASNTTTVMKPSSPLCRVESVQGECVTVWAAIPGRLLEVNSRLATDGSLLFSRPCREGYLAIVYPTNAETRQLQQDLVPLDKYLELRGIAPQELL